MFIKCHNGHVPMHGNSVKKHGGRLLCMSNTKHEDIVEEKEKEKHHGNILSSYCANTVGGLTNGKNVISPADVARRNVNGSGFLTVPLMRTKKQVNRNNLKFNI